MNFESYVAEIERLAKAAGATIPGEPYCEAEAWRDSYEEGLSPAMAWEEEVEAFRRLVGKKLGAWQT